jgi:hypothetical protein
MNLWHLAFLWLVMQMSKGNPPGPNWPGPGVPPQPTPPQPTTPPATPPATPPVDVPPATPPTPPKTLTPNTVWKDFFYVQPDAGAKYGTPYELAQYWTGSGGDWSDMYNFTKGRPISQATGGTQYVDPASGTAVHYDPSSQTSSMKAASAKRTSLHGSPDYADVGDKLLIPYGWPDLPSALAPRTIPIPDGTSLPGVSGVSGEETCRTI